MTTTSLVFSARCLWTGEPPCAWTWDGPDSDRAAEKHTKSGHPTVTEGRPA